jgi:hypothetical protein
MLAVFAVAEIVATIPVVARLMMLAMHVTLAVSALLDSQTAQSY